MTVIFHSTPSPKVAARIERTRLGTSVGVEDATRLRFEFLPSTGGVRFLAKIVPAMFV